MLSHRLCFWSLGFAFYSCINTHELGSQESYAKRDYFYVGGQYSKSGESYVYSDQMYIERLLPSCGVNQSYPIVFMHGNAQTGTNWLNKPDGGKGWASWFLDHGYEVYIVDQVLRARSAWNPGSNISISTYTTLIIQKRFTATQLYKLWPQAVLHTQWPGNGTMGDPIYDQYYASNVQFASSDTLVQTKMQAAGVALLDRIGPAILLSHSQGGLFPWAIADVRPQLVKAILAIEPKGPPFREQIFSNVSSRSYGLTDIPITFEPPVTDISRPLQIREAVSNSPNRSNCLLQVEPAKQLINLRSIPVLLETSESGYHAMYDHCTAQFMQQAGMNVTHLRLEDVGIHGNGHLHFLERNSDAIAAELHRWLGNTLG